MTGLSPTVTPRSASCAVFVPVGPGEPQINALTDLVSSLRTYARGVSQLILVDDGAAPRALADRISWPGIEVVELRSALGKRWVHGYSAMTAGTLAALAYAARQLDCGYLLKLDTDALIIAPFDEQLVREFDSTPRLGLVGAHDTSPGGGARDFSVWAQTIARAASPFHLQPSRGLLPVRPYYVSSRRRRRIREMLRTARAVGYRDGEHCLGGAYAIGRAALDALRTEGFLDDPCLWNGTGLGEDVALGLMVRSAGFDLRGLVDEGEPFGVRFRGLADSPRGLLARGYSIIHSVKSDPTHDERSIRAFFRARRGEC